MAEANNTKTPWLVRFGVVISIASFVGLYLLNAMRSGWRSACAFSIAYLVTLIACWAIFKGIALLIRKYFEPQDRLLKQLNESLRREKALLEHVKALQQYVEQHEMQLAIAFKEEYDRAGGPLQ